MPKTDSFWNFNRFPIKVSDHAFDRFIQRGGGYIENAINRRSCVNLIKDLVKKSNFLKLLKREEFRRLYKYDKLIFVLDLNVHDAQNAEIVVVTCWLATGFEEKHLKEAKIIFSSQAISDFIYFVRTDKFLGREIVEEDLDRDSANVMLQNLLRESNCEPETKDSFFSTGSIFRIFRWRFRLIYKKNKKEQDWVILKDCWLERKPTQEDLNFFPVIFSEGVQDYFKKAVSSSNRLKKRYRKMFGWDVSTFQTEADWDELMNSLFTMSSYYVDKDISQGVFCFDDTRFLVVFRSDVKKGVNIFVVKFIIGKVRNKHGNKKGRKKAKRHTPKRRTSSRRRNDPDKVDLRSFKLVEV